MTADFAACDVAPSDGLTTCDPGLWRVYADIFGDGCDPVWFVRADALFLNRQNPSSQPFIVDGTGATLFDAGQFNFPTQVGWEIDVTRRLTCDWALEASYFSVGGQTANVATINSSTGAGVLYNNAMTGIFSPTGTANVATTLSYASVLQSAEVMARKDITDRVTLLAGFRWLHLGEQGILVAQQAPGAAVTQQVAASNDLGGFQLGADASLLQYGRFSLQTDIKAGIYIDSASNQFVDNPSGAITPTGYFQTGTSTHDPAFAGELGVTAAYELTRNLSLVGGGRLLRLDGVALASQQAAVNSSPALGPATTVATTGGVFYSGAFMGLEYRR